ncbi:hypothetical protein P775_24150 [Puniceibacterium antarcticum]|uniref:HdeD protein n=1 Tax=Puniceibacterium antarcticum TaxID=1206336 RepID=A0A2G8R7H8_9RHOB|nr:DUF308 domain-containing protein [Puniceibacterium antarcticum]PIL17484.1 hypothetical protein P775_24150 [Puniceibacterium antarcticum]
MSVLHPDMPSSVGDKARRGFRVTGLVFAGLGLLAILVPTVATFVVEQLVAWFLILWGIAGLLFASSFRSFSEWRLVAAGFVAVLLAGIAFVLMPGAGATILTGVLISVFLLEGVLSILLGLRLSGNLDSWRWIIFSGACSFALGMILLIAWTDAACWVIGFMVGLNFLSTGLSLLLLSRVKKI